MATDGTLAQVRAAYPELAGARRPAAGGGDLRSSSGDRVVVIEHVAPARWVPDVDVTGLGGPPLVRSLTVRDAAVDPTGC